MLFHFRFSTPSREEIESVTLWLRTIGKVHLSVFEISSKGVSHSHNIIDVDLVKTGFLTAFHRKFKDKYKGNKCLSCEELKKDVESNYRYCCKGVRCSLTKTLIPPVILFNSVLSSEQVIEYQKNHWAFIEKECPSAEGITKKKKVLTFLESCIEKYKEKNYRTNLIYRKSDMEFVHNFILNCLGKKAKGFDHFIVKRLCLGLMNSINPRADSLRKHNFTECFPDLADDRYGEFYEEEETTI
jgi:hypothetical protein